MLTQSEQDLVRAMFSVGPAAFADAGFSSTDMDTFLKRSDVVEAYRLLSAEYGVQEQILARARYLARRRLMDFSRSAVDMLGATLAGPLYVRNEDNTIRLDKNGKPMVLQAAPDSLQFASATRILELLGVEEKALPDTLGGQGILAVLTRSDVKAVIAEDDALSPEEKRLSRERIRTAMELLLKELPLAREQSQRLLKAVTGQAVPRASKALRKSGKAKSGGTPFSALPKGS